MATNYYEKGDLLRCSVTFTSTPSGADLDPTPHLFSYKTPAGVTTILTYGVDGALVKDSVGDYHVDLDANATGTWWFRWYSTGTGQSADEGAFNVRGSQF